MTFNKSILLGTASLIVVFVIGKNRNSELEQQDLQTSDKNHQYPMLKLLERNKRPSGLKFEIASLSKDQILHAIALSETNVNQLYGRNASERTQRLFQQLGLIEGEAALDYIWDTYRQNQPFAAMAMAHALLGWAELDQQAAIQALQGMLIGDGSLAYYLMEWRRQKFLDSLG